MNKNEDMLKKYRNYVIRKYKKNTLKNIVIAIAVALYTSLWWVGIALKNETVLMFSTTLTIIVIFVYVTIVLIDDPVWDTNDTPSKDKDCCTKEPQKCNCEQK